MKDRIGIILLVLFSLLFSASTLPATQQEVTADYVFKNGKVYTVNPNQPWAEAVVVKGNKITFVGSNAEAEKWITPQARVIDLKGRMLMPGFIDGHNHFASGAAGKRGVRLVGSKDTQEMLQRIRDYVKANPQKEVYIGYGWEFPMFGDKGGSRAGIWIPFAATSLSSCSTKIITMHGLTARPWIWPASPKIPRIRFPEGPSTGVIRMELRAASA